MNNPIFNHSPQRQNNGSLDGFFILLLLHTSNFGWLGVLLYYRLWVLHWQCALVLHK